MKKLIWLVLILSYSFGEGFGWANKSESKYDSSISKYDVGMSSFRFKYESGTNCEEVSIKEREAIISDIKSGRFKMKKHPELKGLIFVSGNFASDKEFAYYGDLNTCVKHNRDPIIDAINNSRLPYYGGHRNY